MKKPTSDELKKLDSAIGVDLSLTRCPSSVGIVYRLPERNYIVQSWAWICDKGVEDREKINLPKYQQFIEASHMTRTEGDMIDFALIREFVVNLCEENNVVAVNFDPTSAAVMMNDIQSEGYPVNRYPQSWRNFNGPMIEFRRAWQEKRIWHFGNSWLKYCLTNIRCEENKFGEIRPFTKKAADHTDGGIAVLLGFHSLYEEDTSTPGIAW